MSTNKNLQWLFLGLAILFLAGLIFFYRKSVQYDDEKAMLSKDFKAVKDSVVFWKELADPAMPFAKANPIERNHADNWINIYVAAHTNSLQRVVFDLEKLRRAIDAWDNMRANNLPVNAVAAQLITYDNDIYYSSYGVDPTNPANRKVPGAVSILLSPWDTTGAGQYYYDPANRFTKPINLGDLHP